MAETNDVERGLNHPISLEHEVKRICDKGEHYYSMWLLYSILDRVLLIANFGTLLVCIIVKVETLGLILSFSTLAVGVIFDSKEYVILLGKLLNVYKDHIVPKVNDYRLSVLVNDKDEATMKEVLNQVRFVQRLERYYLTKYMGYTFTLPNSLRTIACRKIIICSIVYISIFICIPVVYHFRS